MKRSTFTAGSKLCACGKAAVKLDDGEPICDRCLRLEAKYYYSRPRKADENLFNPVIYPFPKFRT